jgi:hypothetical protein
VNTEVKFFAPDPYKYQLQGSYPQSASNISGWVAGTKGVLPEFSYFLKDRSSDAVRFAVYDVKGNKIKDFNGTGIKGLNRVTWDLSMNPPKVAKGGFIAGSMVLFASVIGPRVPAGKYRVVMTHNKKEHEQWITIQPNDDAGFSAAGLQRLYDQSMRLFRAEEELYYLVDTLDKKLAWLGKEDSTQTSIQQQMKKINDLRKEILELNRKTVFFDEFKFRRRLCDLYVSVCTQTAPLSSSEEKGIAVMEQELADISRKVKALL